MDWFKAGLTAGAVLMVMLAAQRCGPRLAGVMAALPTVTAPALGWLAHDRGTALAISAAVASVSVCAMLAAFALAYAIAARRAGPLVAVVSGVAGAALATLPALAAAVDLRHALLLAVGSCAVACILLPASDAEVVAFAMFGTPHDVRRGGDRGADGIGDAARLDVQRFRDGGCWRRCR